MTAASGGASAAAIAPTIHTSAAQRPGQGIGALPSAPVAPLPAGTSNAGLPVRMASTTLLSAPQPSADTTTTIGICSGMLIDGVDVQDRTQPSIQVPSLAMGSSSAASNAPVAVPVSASSFAPLAVQGEASGTAPFASGTAVPLVGFAPVVDVGTSAAPAPLQQRPGGKGPM